MGTRGWTKTTVFEGRTQSVSVRTYRNTTDRDEKGRQQSFFVSDSQDAPTGSLFCVASCQDNAAHHRGNSHGRDGCKKTRRIGGRFATIAWNRSFTPAAERRRRTAFLHYNSSLSHHRRESQSFQLGVLHLRLQQLGIHIVMR